MDNGIIKLTEYDLLSVSLSEGQYYYCTDSRKLYVDTDDTRLIVTPIVNVSTEVDRQYNVHPNLGTFYYVLETNELWLFNGKWTVIVGTPKKYNGFYYAQDNTLVGTNETNVLDNNGLLGDGSVVVRDINRIIKGKLYINSDISNPENTNDLVISSIAGGGFKLVPNGEIDGSGTVTIVAEDSYVPNPEDPENPILLERAKMVLNEGNYYVRKDGVDYPVLTQLEGLSTVAYTGSYNDLIDQPFIPVNLSDLTADSLHRTVTDAEKTTWNNKANVSDIPTNISQLTNDAGYVVDANYVHTDYNYNSTAKNIVDNVTSELAGKVDKNGTDSLMTQAEHDKLSLIESGAQVNVQSDWNTSNSSSDSYIKNKPTSLSQFSDDSTHRLVTDTEKASWDGKATENYVDTHIASAIASLPKSMIYKGTLGTGGTISVLPTADAASVGFTYKVITAGTYDGKVATLGDLFICAEPSTGVYEWTLVPSGDESIGFSDLIDVDFTSVQNGQIPIYNSTTSKWENADQIDISGKANKTDIAIEFDTESGYGLGDFVTYQDSIYMCISDHAPGAWDDNDFESLDNSGFVGGMLTMYTQGFTLEIYESEYCSIEFADGSDIINRCVILITESNGGIIPICYTGSFGTTTVRMNGRSSNIIGMKSEGDTLYLRSSNDFVGTDVRIIAGSLNSIGIATSSDYDDATNTITITDVESSGGSGGHTIENASGTSMTQRTGLQFAGYLETTDDSANDKTVVSDAPNTVTYATWMTMTPQQKAGKKWLITGAPGTPGTDLQPRTLDTPVVVGGQTQTTVQSALSALATSGGGGGGHTIEDSTGTAMTQRTNLKFTGAAVTDDSTNNATIVSIPNMVVLSYGHSTWTDFINAYNSNTVVYCRASSNASNPGTGNQTRLAFMAYVNNESSPTEVEFQYYRSVGTKSASQQGDQVFVYKLNKQSSGAYTWSFLTRPTFTEVVSGNGVTTEYSNSQLKLNTPSIAPSFSTSTSYAVNDLVFYNGNLYKCTTAHSAGAWNASDFTQTTIGAELSALLSR